VEKEFLNNKYMKIDIVEKGIYKIKTHLISPVKPDYKYFLQRKGVLEYIISEINKYNLINLTSAYSYYFDKKERDGYLIIDTNDNFYD